MSEREKVLDEFGTALCAKGDDCTHFGCVVERKMADKIVTLRKQLTAMTEARDLWQGEAGVQQAYRERAEKHITELEEVVGAFQSWHQKTGPDSLPLLTEAVSKLNEFSMPKPSPA